MKRSIQSHLTIILQLNTRQHWCVLLPVQLLLSATDLNNSNKQTSPAFRARLLQQLLHTHVTPGKLNLVLQACCARLSAASGLTSALPHAAVQSVCVAVQTHSDFDPRYANSSVILVSHRAFGVPIMAWMAQGNSCCCCELCTFVSSLKRISSMIAYQATSTGAFDHSK
jgi:hypothetical protein